MRAPALHMSTGKMAERAHNLTRVCPDFLRPTVLAGPPEDGAGESVPGAVAAGTAKGKGRQAKACDACRSAKRRCPPDCPNRPGNQTGEQPTATGTSEPAGQDMAAASGSSDEQHREDAATTPHPAAAGASLVASATPMEIDSR